MLDHSGKDMLVPGTILKLNPFFYELNVNIKQDERQTSTRSDICVKEITYKEDCERDASKLPKWVVALKLRNIRVD